VHQNKLQKVVSPNKLGTLLPSSEFVTN